MTVNSSVLPFSWIFSLFMRVTISCSLSWAWELDADAAAPFPSPASVDVIISVCRLPHKLQRNIQTHLFVIDFSFFFLLPTLSLQQNMWKLELRTDRKLHEIIHTKKKARSYLFLLATTAHTRRIATIAKSTRRITSQSGGRNNKLLSIKAESVINHFSLWFSQHGHIWLQVHSLWTSGYWRYMWSNMAAHSMNHGPPGAHVQAEHDQSVLCHQVVVELCVNKTKGKHLMSDTDYSMTYQKWEHD